MPLLLDLLFLLFVWPLTGGFFEDAPLDPPGLLIGLVYEDREYHCLVLRMEVVLRGGLHDHRRSLGLVDDVAQASVWHLLCRLVLQPSVRLHNADGVVSVLGASDLLDVEHPALEVDLGAEQGFRGEPAAPYDHLRRK